jgi:hypothetical protein
MANRSGRAVDRALLVGVTVAAVAGCGGGSGPDVSADDIEAALLTEQDLPESFRVAELVEPEVEGFEGCLLSDLEAIPTHADGEVRFIDGVDEVSEALFVPRDPADEVVRDVRASAEGCDAATGTVDGVEIAIAYEPLDLDLDLTPPADEVVGVDLRLAIESFEQAPVVREHLVISRRGEVVTVVLVAGIDGVDPRFTAEVVEAAHERSASLGS